MSFSTDTLQDFVMGLINDEAAKAAYLADPLAALSNAGLADLTPADVAEVLPLVADSLPAGLPTDLTGGLPGLDGLPVDLPLDGLPIDLPTDGLPVDLPGVPDLGDLPGLGHLPSLPNLGDLPGLGDLPVHVPGLPTLETPVGDVSAVVGDAAAKVDLDGDIISTSTSGFLSNDDNSDAPTVSNFTSTAFGDLAAGAKLDADEFGGSVAGHSDVADVSAGLIGHDSGEVAAFGSLDTVAGDLGAGLLASPEGFALAAETPLVNIEANSHGDFSIQPVDTSDLLDIDHLGSTGDAVAGTVAHVVSTGADSVAGGVASGAGGLAGYLTGPAAPVAGVVQHGADTVSEGIAHGGDALTEHLSDLPTVGGLPLDHLPQLPTLPDLPDLDSGALPSLPDVGHLPIALPSLPVDLPDTSAVTGLVTDNPVTDAVHASPVGGLVDGVTSHLPQVADLPGDLDLGL